MTDITKKNPAGKSSDLFPGPPLSEVEAYLKRYQVERKILEAELRHQKVNTCVRDAGLVPGDDRENAALSCRASMHEIREFVRSLPDCNEKVFLFSRYLCGESVEAIAESQDVSLRSIYRLRSRALILAARHFHERKQQPGA